MTPIRRVLDASAVLAFINDEPGADQVRRRLPGAAIGTVNVAEVVGKLIEAGIPNNDVRRIVASLSLTVIPFDETMAFEAGALQGQTKTFGMSLGDRACLATCRVLKAIAVTADRTWRQLKVGVRVESIR
jgi:PIN domain nuclease of toxin-antitoxin system